MSDNKTMDELFGSIFGENSKGNIARLSENYIDVLLKYFQILYYAHQLGKDDLAEEVSKKFEPMIKVLADNMSEEVQKYQAKHGEI